MGARWMEQKRAKMKRERRAWAKQYSRPSGIVPNRGVIVQYKQTAKGLGLDENEIDIYILATYGVLPMYRTPAGKQEVLEHLKELKKKVPGLQFFQIIDNAYWRVRIFYGAPNDEPTHYILEKLDKRFNTIQRSICYHSKQRAMDVWYNQTVRWISTEVAPPSV